jgi:hypothetical protein
MESESFWVPERLKLYDLMRGHPDWSLRHYARELGHDLHWVRQGVSRIKAATALTLDTFRSRARRTIPRRASATRLRAPA